MKRKPPAKLTFELKLQIRKDYEKGLSNAELMKKYDIGYGTIRNAVLQTGGTMNSPPTTPHCTQAQKDEIVNRYIAGEQCSELGPIYNVSRATIYNYLVEADIETRTPGGTLTPSQIKEIAMAYQEAGTSTPVSEKYNVTPMTVIRSAKKHNIPIKNDTGMNRKYTLNTNFFNLWSPNMAYILGFIFADGHISKNAVIIYQKEPEILNDIKKILDYNGPLHMTGTDRSIHTLMMSSRPMVASLAQHNLFPGSKTYTARLPGVILYPQDFIRGYFDGDGHGGYYKHRNKKRLSIGFTSGSKDLLKDIMNLIPAKMRGPYKGKGRSYSIQTAGKEAALELKDWMYDTHSDLNLDRKKRKLFP